MLLSESPAPPTKPSGRRFLGVMALGGLILINGSGATRKKSDDVTQATRAVTLANVTALLHSPAVTPTLNGLVDGESVLSQSLSIGDAQVTLRRTHKGSLELTLGETSWTIGKVGVLGKSVDPGELIADIRYNAQAHTFIVMPSSGIAKTLVTKATVPVESVERAMLHLLESDAASVQIILPCKPEGPAVRAANAAGSIPGVEINTTSARIPMMRRSTQNP